MPVATNQQVQTFVNERIRPRAEQFRALVALCADDKIAIEDIYAAAVAPTDWTDQRTDGPPHLLSLNDTLTYNSIITLFAKFKAGTATAQDSIDFAANWPVFQRACVRAIGA